MSLAIESDPSSSAPISWLTASNAFSFFNRHLKVILADSEDLLDIVYRLRFRIYCIERGFERAAEFLDGRERDRDDLRSLHTLLIHRDSGAAIGTVRLILPRQGDELPVFRVIGSDKRSAAGLPFETTAEVSRFAVAKSFRRSFEKSWCWGTGCGRVPASTGGVPMQLLTFGLMRSVVVMTSCAGISHIVGMMEPALLRLLGRLGIVFHRAGEPVEYHGLRQPGWAGVAHLVERARDSQPDLWAIAAAGCRFGGRPGLAHAG